VLGLLFPFVNHDLHWLDSVIGAVVGFGSFALLAVVGKFVFKKEALGMGDWFLLAMIGAFLGWQALLPVIFVGSLLGSVVGLTLIALGRGQPGPELATAGGPVAGSTAPVSEGDTSAAQAPVDGEFAAAAEAETASGKSHDDSVSGQGIVADEEEDWVPPKNSVPFGPFLALGALAQLFAGDWLRETYFHLFSSLGR
jgi:leader peptidase (prepilin peptidase)/N-methyltransferase